MRCRHSFFSGSYSSCSFVLRSVYDILITFSGSHAALISAKISEEVFVNKTAVFFLLNVIQ